MLHESTQTLELEKTKLPLTIIPLTLTVSRIFLIYAAAAITLFLSSCTIEA